MTPEQRVLRAKLAAHARWAMTEDRVGATESARAGWWRRWERQVDPEGTLPVDERAKRADHAMRAHMAGLSLKASTKRRGPRRPATA